MFLHFTCNFMFPELSVSLSHPLLSLTSLGREAGKQTGRDSCACFPDEDTKSKRGKVTGPRSYTQSEMSIFNIRQCNYSIGGFHLTFSRGLLGD